MKSHHFGFAARAALVLLAFTACGKKEITASPAVGQFAVSGSVYNGETTTAYISVVSSLDANQTIDYTKALPIPSGVALMGPDNEGYFVLGRGDEPTLQRYDYTTAGELKAGAKMSLSSLGVTNTWAGPQWGFFISPTVAYYVSVGSFVAAQYNPTTMTLTKSIDLSGLALDNDPNQVKYSVYTEPVLVGDKLYVSAVYQDNDDDSTYAQTNVAVVDAVTGNVTYIRDTRCGPGYTVAKGPDGKIYVSSFLFRYNPVGRPATPASCLLRIDPATHQFDPNFYVETKATLGGGKEISSVIFAGDGTPFTRVFHSNLYTAQSGDTSDTAVSAPAWTWMQLEKTFTQAGTDLGGDPTSGPGGYISSSVIDGQTYVVTAGASTSTVFQLSSAGVKQLITGNGEIYGLVKLR